jgi:ribosomal protein S20
MIATMQDEYRRTAWKLQIKELVDMVSSQKNDYSNFLLSSSIEKLFELKEKGILSDMEYHSLK